MRPFPLVLPMLAGVLHASARPAVEPAALSTLEDGELALRIAEPSIGLPPPALIALSLLRNAAPQGVAFASARNEVVFANLLVPTLHRIPLDVPATTPEAGT